MLKDHPGGDYVKRVSKGRNKGYVKMTAAEIKELEDWRATLPAKQERRERERRAKGYEPIKELPEDKPNGKTRELRRFPAAQRTPSCR